MTSTWMDDVELDDSAYLDAEYDDSELGEDYDSGEDYDAESAASRRRRAQQRVAMARRRQALARARSRGRGALAARGARPVPAASAAGAIRELDLESKVAEDSLRRAVTAQGKRMSRSEYAAVASVAVSQFIESFQAPDDPFVQAALRFSPLLLLSPQKRGTGLEAFVKDPRVVGAAAVAGITLAARNRNKFTGGVRQIDAVGPARLTSGGSDQFFAFAKDDDGNVVAGATVTWESSRAARATVDADGVVTAGTETGPVAITARSGNVTRVFHLFVEPAGSQATKAAMSAASSGSSAPAAKTAKAASKTAKKSP